jgi:hypothetical protein
MRGYQPRQSTMRSHAFQPHPARTRTNAGTSGNTPNPEKRATKCATSDAVSAPSVDELAEAIARLTPTERAMIEAMLAEKLIEDVQLDATSLDDRPDEGRPIGVR